MCKIQNKGKQKTEITKLKKQKQKQSKKQAIKKMKEKTTKQKNPPQKQINTCLSKRLKIPNGYAITRRRDNTIAKEGQNYK